MPYPESILTDAVEDFIAALPKGEFDALVARTRDPETADEARDNAAAEERDTNKIADRMFGRSDK